MGSLGSVESASGVLAAGAGLGLAVMYGTGFVRGRRDADGFATVREMRGTLSARALVARRATLRPSLVDVRPRSVDPLDVAVWLGKPVGRRWSAYLACEDSLLVLAPPGAGKTAFLGHALVDARGPVIATSTKLDIVRYTEALRAARGPVWLFNPESLGGREGTLYWDPVVGCEDPDVAMNRAGHLLSGSDGTSGIENRSFWLGNTFKVLKSFLWAAAVDGRSLADVARWSKQQSDQTAIEIMRKHADIAPEGWLDDLVQVQVVKGKPTTSESVFTTLALTFGCMSRPRVAEMIRRAHDPKNEAFDIDGFLTGTGTLYMLAKERAHGGSGPLFSCLVGEIHDRASELASYGRNERLDPGLLMVLDEAALICPVPLETWSSDSRGKNISMIVAMQSLAQLYMRWGDRAGQIIWGNLGKYILGGISVPEHLRIVSDLCGTRTTMGQSSTSGPTGRSVTRSPRDVPVMSTEAINHLGPGEALFLPVRGMRPVLLKFTPVWERKDVQAHAGDSSPAPVSTAAPVAPVVSAPAPVHASTPPAPAASAVPVAAASVPVPPSSPVPPSPPVPAASVVVAAPAAPVPVLPVPAAPVFPPAAPVGSAQDWPPRLYVVHGDGGAA